MKEELNSSFELKLAAMEAEIEHEREHFEALLESSRQATDDAPFHGARWARCHRELLSATSVEAELPRCPNASLLLPIATGEAEQDGSGGGGDEPGKTEDVDEDNAAAHVAGAEDTAKVAERRSFLVRYGPLEVRTP